MALFPYSSAAAHFCRIFFGAQRITCWMRSTLTVCGMVPGFEKGFTDPCSKFVQLCFLQMVTFGIALTVAPSNAQRKAFIKTAFRRSETASWRGFGFECPLQLCTPI